MKYNIDKSEILAEFSHLVSIDSLSYQERAMADELKAALEKLEAVVWEDQAGATHGSNTGNVYGFFKGDLPGEPILFSAHMDTVGPGFGKKAICTEDGRITSDGTTVLGSDDLAGVVEILSAIRMLKREGIPHRDIEVLFTISEETYLGGSTQLDFQKIRSREAYVLDGGGDLGFYSKQEPTLIGFVVKVHGKSAHSGMAAGSGIHAINIAAKAITQVPQGQLDENTVANIGVIAGGTATNIIPDYVEIKGEVRSYIHEHAFEILEQIKEIFEQAATEYGATIDFDYTAPLKAYQVDSEHPVAVRFREACDNHGLRVAPRASFGGSDNNVFMRNGVYGMVLACGMHEIHTTDEYTTIQELELMTKIVTDLMTAK